MSKHICRVLHALTIVGILSASAPTAIAQSTNVRPDIVHHGFASALDGENLFVIGGLLNFEGNTRRLTANYKINLTTGDTASISTDVIFGNGNAAALWQGAIYVSGGSALVSHGIGNSGVYSTGFSDAFAVYDIANDTWRTLSDLPTTAIGHCSFANDGSVYVVGGQQERSMRPFRSPYITATRVLRYSIADDRWSPIETPEGVLSQYAACTRLGDEYFLIGGFRDSVASNEVRVWNFADNTWRRAPDLPNAVSGAVATTHEGAIYVAGGSTYSDVNGAVARIDDRRIWRLREGAQEWEVAGEISAQRFGHAMISWNDGIFLIGGQASGGQRPPGLWVERLH
jgi:N-acetylneuraminic acid mutarotase